MIKRLTVFFVVIAAAGVFIAFGCGAGPGTTGHHTLEVKIDAASGAHNLDLSGLLLDASSGTTATTAGAPAGIADTANSTCDFTVAEGTLYMGGASDGNIELTMHTTDLAAAKAECTNVSNCVWCHVTSDDPSSSCNITCSGAIAVNAYTPEDYFDITFLATHAFNTEMEADGQGMIRIDGDPINFGDGSDDLEYASQDFIQTSCSDSANVVVEDESNTTLTGLTVSGDAYDATSSDGTYHEYYEITTSAGSEGSSKTCTVQDQVVVRCTVPAGITGATVIDCATSATWQNSASLCQGQDNCDQYTY